MRNAKPILLALLGLAGAAFGQTPPPVTTETLLQQNETVVGLGGMLSLTNLVVNDQKTWILQLATSFPDSNRDGCLYSNGFVIMREGSPLPNSSSLDDWAGLSLNSRGDLGMIIKVRPPIPGTIFDGAHWNGVMVAKKDQVIDVPPFSAHPTIDTDWENIQVIKLNNRNEMFLMGEVANPAITRTRERALVRYQLDDNGNILDTTVLGTEGMTVDAGLSLTGAACLLFNDNILDVNDRGDFITFIAQEGIQALVINMETVVARSGTMAPNGKLWKASGAFNLSRVGINDRGEYVLSGGVDPNNGFLIVKNGEKFAEEGDVLPDIGVLGGGTTPALLIANTGDVFWHNRTSTGDAFLRNFEIIVQGGRTIIENRLVTALNAAENAFAISSDGRFFVANLTLQTVGQTAVFVDFGLVLELPGCHDNPGKLRHAGGNALLGKSFQLELDEAQAPGASAALFFSRRAFQSPAGCGVLLDAYGELMLAPPVAGPRSLGTWDGTNPIVTTMNIPNRIALLDTVFFAQGLFFSPGHPTERFRLTNGMRIEIGAP